jgi:acetylglutamate synthase
MSTQELEITPAVLPATPKVSVGPTSVVGWGATAAGVIGMVLTLVLHVDQEEAVLISTAAMTVIAFVVTQVGRFTQAKEIAKGTADAHRAVVARLTMPPQRMIGAGTSITAATDSSSGDPDNPLVERPLTDKELASLAGPAVVDDPDSDPPRGRPVRDEPQA